MEGNGSSGGEFLTDPPAPDGTGLENVPAPLRDVLRKPGVSPHLVSATISAFAASYAGPLPPAEQIRAYEQVLTGSADRILRMAEEQQKHRHHLERTTVEGASHRAWWGLWLGFVISLVVLGLGTLITLEGYTWEGASVMGVDVVALAGVFVYGRREQRKERETKDAQSRASGKPGPPARR